MNVGEKGRGDGVKRRQRGVKGGQRTGPRGGRAGEREGIRKEGKMTERIASCGSLCDSTNLLLQYCNNDDTVSASSNMDMEDRVSHLEQRLQLQEDEIQLLKSALADALRRLGYCEEQSMVMQPGGVHAAGRRPLATTASAPPTKVRQLLQALPSRPLSNGYVQQKRLLSSPSSPKKEVLQSIKRKSMSTERLTLVRREMGAESRSRTTSSSSSSGGKSKSKECTFNAEDGYVRMFLRGRPVTMHIPDQQRESYSLDHKVALPDRKLKLQWVYGYRGRDCRSNLYLLPTGEIVYFNASVVVLYNTEEQQQRHYLGHNDDVKCLSVHPDMVTIATGQVAGNSKDGKLLAPHVRVWDSVSLNTLHVIGMGVFDRAVTCVAFSKSNGGTFLCAVDDANDHILSVWNWQKEKQLADVKCSNDSVLAAVFHPMDANLIVTCGKSHINFWTMEGNTLTKRQGLFEKHEKPKYVLCLAFAENGDAITGDSSGNIYIWAKGGNRISQVVSGAHEGGIFSVCVLKDGTMVSGGGKDRRVVLWDHDYRKQAEMEVGELFGPVRALSEGKAGELFVGTTKNAIIRASFPDTLTPVVQGHTDELWVYSVMRVVGGQQDLFYAGNGSFQYSVATARYITRPNHETQALDTLFAAGCWQNSCCCINNPVLNVAGAGNACTGEYGHSSFGCHPSGLVDRLASTVTQPETTRSSSEFGQMWSRRTDINAVCRSHTDPCWPLPYDFGKVHLFSFLLNQGLRATSTVATAVT
ncbi:echinoderm microtubule-associated protein-like 2 isoform X1 [Lates japonicus]|uniref:Echinoderm microtubule-associated protein-like 2 isoform X1 n=1 Tax=Lates japonicus TaxID=270547 RepID=A0AAD3MF40_LATJO|nr:echinoderm microtubule-associated protein-like 2 isoform X1 [Lates japonicus]